MSAVQHFVILNHSKNKITMQIKDRIHSLRKQMKENNIDAFIVFSADPHMSEYLPEAWKEREWISGFTGSAGFVVILQDKAGLWTDGRYFTQAPIELEGSGIDLFKDGIEGTPHYINWIISETKENANIAVNALVTAHEDWENLKNSLAKEGKNLININLLDKVWTERPEARKNPIFVHPLERAGQSVEDKIKAIRNAMQKENASGHIITSLDDVAWTLNLRGSDVACNPVFLAYIYIAKEKAYLFVDQEKLKEEAINLMENAHVEIKDYKEFFPFLENLKEEHIWVSPRSNQAIFEAISQKNTLVKKAVPGNLMKAIKNEKELAGFREVMIRDGVAMVQFLHWLTTNVGEMDLDEYTIGKKLYSFRAAQKNFVGQSFGSIVGYLENGAIIHYSAPEKGSKKVFKKGSILVDSGGQYLEGTTDITRTFPLGEVDDDFIEDATLVLKGMIQLSMMKFPKGTSGMHLDAIARKALWEEGKDYNHGTGHGVGSFMNVHEGPQNIRKDINPTVLEAGMVVSNEPGYYVEGKYGIRHENLIAVKEWKKTEWNTFYEFETLTLCPFFTSAIDKNLLTKEELDWLNAYHQTCKDKLLPHLEGEVKEWFLEKVKAI